MLALATHIARRSRRTAAKLSLSEPDKPKLPLGVVLAPLQHRMVPRCIELLHERIALFPFKRGGELVLTLEERNSRILGTLALIFLGQANRERVHHRQPSLSAPRPQGCIDRWPIGAEPTNLDSVFGGHNMGISGLKVEVVCAQNSDSFIGKSPRVC